MEITEALVLEKDVLIIPVDQLKPDVRSQFDCDDDDFAVSRPLSRSPSSVVDAQTAALLERFREPRTIVEAVILFSRERGLDPDEVLVGAYPAVRRFLANRWLVAADSQQGEGVRPSFKPGQELAAGLQRPLGGTEGRSLQRPLGGTEGGSLQVVELLYLLEDTELYLVRRGDEQLAVLKIERPGERDLGEIFAREAEILRQLDGRAAPRLYDEGALDGRPYLLLEFCPGVDAETAAAEWQGQGGGEARRELLQLCRAIAEAYARLHAAGVIHGDVHPRNVLVDREGAIRLVDFGLARSTRGGERVEAASRGGVAFYFEPEYAAARRSGRRLPPASEAGEQHSLAALLHQLLTGVHYLDFSLEPQEMMRQIAEEAPASFADRGLEPWPEVEAVLARALAKDPARRFPSVVRLAEALAAVPAAADEPAEAPRAPSPAHRSLDRILDDFLANSALDGPWFSSGLEPAPTASLNLGAAGVAYALYRIAVARDAPALLSAADAWASRAAAEIGREEAFYNEEIEVTREMVGESSPFHSPSGVFAVQALIARALDDPNSQGEAVTGFHAASAAPAQGLDLTLGRSSTLLACAWLLDSLHGGAVDPEPVLDLGRRTMAEVWESLAAMPAIAEAEVEYLGAAHGWAGFAYAALQWCRAAGAEPPAGIEDRLDQLVRLAEPTGRGIRWPWTLGKATREGGNYMPGWCNGSAGYVFLWTLAHRLLGAAKYLDLALATAWDVWDAPDRYPSLCCGLTGRSYALLNLFKHTGERRWLRRAAELARRAARERGQLQEFPHSLYKGEAGLAVLVADLERPDEAAQPFYEEEGWPPPVAETEAGEPASAG